MKYLFLSEFKAQKGDFSFPIEEEKLAAFREVVYQFSNWQTVSIPDKENFISEVCKTEVVLFRSWLEQNTLLSNALKGDFKLNYSFSSRDFPFIQHQLFSSFTVYLSPYLSEKIHETNLIYTSSLSALSFSSFLEEKNQDEVHAALSDSFLADKELFFSQCKLLKSDQSMYEAIVKKCTPAFLSELNLFNRKHYFVRLSWSESLLSLANHPKCSKRLLLEVFRIIDNLQLEKEHKLQLSDLKESVKNNSIQYQSSRIPWKKAVALVCLSLVALSLIVGIWFIPKEKYYFKEQEETSFMKLSKEERLHLDSLIKQNKEEIKQKNLTYQETLLPENDITLVQKKHWKNQQYLNIYSTWRKDTIKHANFLTTKIFSKPQKKHSAFKNLLQKSGDKLVRFNNRSNLNVCVIAFKDATNEPLYGIFLGNKEVANFKLNTGEYLCVLPGGDSKINGLPFKEVDERFFNHLENNYELKENTSDTVSIVWQDFSGFNVFLMDLNNAFIKN